METIRTVLSKPTNADFDDILALQTNEQVRKHLGGPVQKEGFLDKFKGMIDAKLPESYWIVRDKANDAFIGLICIAKYHDRIHYEVSYELHPIFWKKGYGTEVVKAVVDYGLQTIGLQELYAETQKANRTSVRLLEKIGMEFVSQVERFGDTQVVYRITRKSKGAKVGVLPAAYSSAFIIPNS